MKKVPKLKLLIIIFSSAAISVLFISKWSSVEESTSPAEPSLAQTTSNQPTAQESFSEGTERQPGNTLREDEGTAVISDNAGVDKTPEDSQTSITSDTGEITLFTPTEGVTLSDGYTISGKSSLKTVSYRLIDDISGVIATGSLDVVNGRFSGKISYNTNASEGRLDIYATRPDLSEYSNIEVNIRFK